MGHSFGAYILGNYAIKYPQYIKKLILLSPIGLKLTDIAIDKNGDVISTNEINNQAFDEFPGVVQVMLSFVW